MADIIKGEVGILSLYDGTAYRPVACLTSNGIDSELSIIESNTKCDPGVTIKNPGVLNRSISADGELIDTTSIGGDTAKASWDYLFERQGQQVVDKLPIEFRYDVGITDQIYYGNCIMSSLNLTQGSGDENSTFSITLEVSGDVTKTNPNP